jgi:hypothetical protein
MGAVRSLEGRKQVAAVRCQVAGYMLAVRPSRCRHCYGLACQRTPTASPSGLGAAILIVAQRRWQ